MGCCFSVKTEIEEPILETCNAPIFDWKDYDQLVTTANQLRKKYNNTKLGRTPPNNPET